MLATRLLDGTLKKLVLTLLLVWAPLAAAQVNDAVLELEQQLASATGEERVELLNRLARAVQRNDPRASIGHAEKAAELAEEIGDDRGLAASFNNIGVGYYFLAEYPRALTYYERSLQITESTDAVELMASSLNNIGVLYYMWGEYDQALDFYSRTLEVRRTTGDTHGVATSYNNLANVYHATERYEEALNHLTVAFDLYLEVGDENFAASTLNNIGLANYELERHDDALLNFEQALEFVQELDDKPTLAFTLNNLGMAYGQLGRRAEALDLYRRSIAVREEIGDRQGVATCLHNLGETYYQLDRHPEALVELDKALRLAEEIDVKEIQRDIHKTLSAAYREMDDHRLALEHHEHYTAINAGLFDEQTGQKLAEWQARFDVERKDKEIALLQKDKKIHSLVRNVAIGGALLLLFVALLLYNRYRLKERAAIEMERANDALRQAQAERERAARAELTHVSRVAVMGELATSLAHELNQPLTAIMSNAQATKRLAAVERPDMPVIGEALNDIVSGADRARSLIRRLRDLVRRHEVQSEPLDFNVVLRDVEKIVRIDAEHEGVRLNFDLATDVPEISGDRIQLQQVVINLVHNAVEAMRDGMGDKEVVVSTHAAESGGVTVAVRDTGPGVDDAAIVEMFKPFHTTKADGLGMGLPICSSIIDAHGGTLSAERNDDHGLTLRFSLPENGKA